MKNFAFPFIAFFCFSLGTSAQKAPQILLNGAPNHPYYVFENHLGSPICFSFSAVNPDTASKDSIELYWNNGLPGPNVWFSLEGYDRLSEMRRLCWNPADTLPLCNLWYFTVYARYKNKPNSPVSSRVIPIRITKPFTANLHFPQTGPFTFQLVPETYRKPQGVCSPNDTNIVRYQWTVSKTGNGLFSHIGAYYYNSKTAEHTFTQPGNYVVRLRMESDDYCCTVFRFDTIRVAGVTDAPEIAAQTFSVYPNPAKDLVYVSTTAQLEKLWLTDLTGRSYELLYTHEGQSYAVTLPVGITSGVYFIRAASGAYAFVRKLYVQ